MYHNPVKVLETNRWIEKCREVQEELGIDNPLVITSNGNLIRHELSKIFNYNSIFSNVEPNPTFESCKSAISFANTSNSDGIIAIGGGSVMDTAKVVLASLGTGVRNTSKLLQVGSPYKNKVPSIFIPTTHGSGSEVTMWGTVWNMKEKKKYSIAHPDLYPDYAILDGGLTLSLPIDISFSTTLDALSHSFEAIWNKNSNPISTNYAIEAIYLILENIERLTYEPQNIDLRNTLLKASNIAGFAISNTKTAAAHSISYPLTINFNIPHGIACSLPLLPLLYINKDSINEEIELIIEKLGLNNFSELADCVKRIFSCLSKSNLREWGVVQSDLEKLVDQSFTKDRMENNIELLSKSDVKTILNNIYQ